MSILFALAFHSPGGGILERHHNLTAEQVAETMREAPAGSSAQLVRTETVWTGDPATWAGELQKGGAG